jgi:hypothetical protein
MDPPTDRNSNPGELTDLLPNATRPAATRAL